LEGELMANITKVSWNRLKGQAEFEGDKPGGALIHKNCGQHINVAITGRSLWLENGPGPCAGTGQVVQVGELYCTQCDQEPTTQYGSPIYEKDYFDPEQGQVAA
jgi:hypothetical protein